MASNADRLIDKMIGDAYPVVKNVYDNMPLVFAVGTALTDSNVGDPLLVQRALIQTGASPVAGATDTIDFSDVSIDYTKILGSSVRILGKTSGALYFEGAGHFSYTIDALGLHLTLPADAPQDIQQALVQWFLIYGP
jgi:hypothetical protein